MPALLAHPWPGNVRELENAIERAAVLARGEEIGAEDLLLAPPRTAGAPHPPAGLRGTLQDTLDEAARRRLQATLETHGGRRAEAAQELGIDRTTLYRLMKRLGI